jgi:predicted acylesterase/phospholipase RssA
VLQHLDGGRADLISSKPHCALILPGAVAKGAYEAGAIEELTHREIRIDRIVATSSGALNGVAYPDFRASRGFSFSVFRKS